MWLVDRMGEEGGGGVFREWGGGHGGDYIQISFITVLFSSFFFFFFSVVWEAPFHGIPELLSTQYDVGPSWDTRSD